MSGRRRKENEKKERKTETMEGRDTEKEIMRRTEAKENRERNGEIEGHRQKVIDRNRKVDRRID